MDKSVLRSFAHDAESILETQPEADEANTKAKVIRPFLEALGWDVQHDAELEYSFQMGSSQHSVDYALRIDGALELFVEAKGAYETLSDRHRQQLNTYLVTENVDWGLLTNGEEYELCHRRIDGDNNVVVDTFGSVDLSDIPDEIDLVMAFSKESIRDGRARKIAERRRGMERAYERLQEKEPAVVEGVTDALLDHLGEVVAEEAEAAAQTTVEDLATRLRNQTTDGPVLGEPDLFWARVEEQTGIVKRNTMIDFPDERTATDCFADFVDLLFSDGLLDESDVPVEAGRKRYVLNHHPVDKVGDDMVSSRAVGEEFYLETNFSVDKIRQRILELTEIARSSTETDNSE